VIFIRCLIIISIFLPAKTLSAQLDSFELFQGIETELEQYIENLELASNFDFNTYFENLKGYATKPLALNVADKNELESLGLLTPLQIKSLLDYRNRVGELIAIYELQAIPYFDLKTIARILPFVQVHKHLDDLQVSFRQLLKNSDKKLILNWSRVLEKAKGFEPNGVSEEKPFAGDPNKVYIRYLQSYYNRISFGFTLEKDPGEEFFKGANAHSFDFMSFHFLYKKVNHKINKMVLGDFRAQFGQGLILNTGFSLGKGTAVNHINRIGPTFSRFTAANESEYLRGIGLSLKLNAFLELNSFISSRKLDAIENKGKEEEPATFSIQNSGFHRTNREIAAKNRLNHLSTGWSLAYQNKHLKIACSTLFNYFNEPVAVRLQPYNQFDFRGKRLFNTSVDYNYIFKNLTFLGEIAWSDNNSVAMLHGITAKFHPKITFSVHLRHFPRNFHSLLGQAFSETRAIKNENGFYVGLAYQANRRWNIALYMDSWQHPWLRFKSDAPSRGREFFGRISYSKTRDFDLYIQWKLEQKQESYRFLMTKLDALLYKYKTNFRIHFNKKINKVLELRSRLEWSFFDIEDSYDEKDLIWYNGDYVSQKETKSNGFMLYQDIIYKPIDFPLSISTRFALYDVSNYDARIYAYEQDLTYQFSIPSYYNQGTRFYFNLKYKLSEHLRIEGRYAQTYWANQNHFGSGINRIEGAKKSQLKIQVRWVF
jgi:hypothetical protein